MDAEVDGSKIGEILDHAVDAEITMLSGVGGASAQETCFCLAVQLLCHLLLRDQPSARILSRRIPEELSRQLDILGKFTDAQMAMEEANFAQFYTCLLPATESHVLGPMVQLLMESTRLANVKLISKMYESLSLQTVGNLVGIFSAAEIEAFCGRLDWVVDKNKMVWLKKESEQ